MIQIAIVEDEEIYVKQLTEYIRKYQTEKGRSIKVTVFGDGEDITENYSGGFDIILMDIQMRFMDGMTAAEKIRQMDQKVIIMFITNMIQYAVRGYEVDAMDYVVKPFEYFSFSQKLDKAVGRMRYEVKEFLTIPIGEGKHGIPDEAYVAFDGVDEVELTSGDMVEIRKAEAQTRIIKLNQDSFLETLRRKMKGN